MATDVANDLHAPLLPREKLSSKLAGLLARFGVVVTWFTRIGGALLVLLAVGLAGWVFSVDNRLGGEPQAMSAIQVAQEVPSQVPFAGSGDGAAQPLPQAPGEPRILRVPQADPETAQTPSVPQPVAGSAGASAPRFNERGGLPALANPGLVQRFDADSFVPSLGANGERALDAYARPLEAGTVAQGQPRIALIVGGLGMSQTSTQAVIDRLPPATTLSFAPYGNSLSRWATRARAAGHEYLIEVPMEPFDFPNNDPGPHTLQVGLEPQANIERMHWALSRLPTPVGLMNYMGARFASEDAVLDPIVRDAIGRGLMMVDDGRSARSRIGAVARQDDPVMRADVVVDARASQEAINASLAQLEAIARDRGFAMGVATALPLTITSLEEWSSSLAAKGIALVPASSLVRF